MLYFGDMCMRYTFLVMIVLYAIYSFSYSNVLIDYCTVHPIMHSSHILTEKVQLRFVTKVVY